jgi:hypothetical protein
MPGSTRRFYSSAEVDKQVPASFLPCNADHSARSRPPLDRRIKDRAKMAAFGYNELRKSSRSCLSLGERSLNFCSTSAASFL